MIIYKITNKLNGRVYIGQTIRTLNERMKDHKCRTKMYIDKALKTYGIDNFDISIIDKADTIEELNNKEIYWISHYKSNNKKYGYNILSGGNNASHTCSEETRIKISKSLKGIKSSNRTRVNQFDKKYNFIRQWECMKDITKETGIHFNTISECCKVNNRDKGIKHHISKGYIWEYVDEPKTRPYLHKNKSKEVKSKGKKVYCLDINTNEILFKFNSIKEAGNNLNIDSSCIGKCCNEKYSQTHGYKFKFA